MSDLEAQLEWFKRRETYVRLLLGCVEDTARDGGGIQACWRFVVEFEMENSYPGAQPQEEAP